MVVQYVRLVSALLLIMSTYLANPTSNSLPPKVTIRYQQVWGYTRCTLCNVIYLDILILLFICLSFKMVGKLAVFDCMDIYKWEVDYCRKQ